MDFETLKNMHEARQYRVWWHLDRCAPRHTHTHNIYNPRIINYYDQDPKWKLGHQKKCLLFKMLCGLRIA